MCVVGLESIWKNGKSVTIKITLIASEALWLLTVASNLNVDNVYQRLAYK